MVASYVRRAHTITSCLKQYCQSVCTGPTYRNVILFPGQGSQFVGMTANLIKVLSAKELFDSANEILGYDLLEKCLKGPKEDLDKTVFCQPAVFVASLAAFEIYKEMQDMGHRSVGPEVVTAGFSVGELAALVLGKALTFEDGLKLVDIRANAMQQASDEHPSGMVTITGLTEHEVEDLLKKVRDQDKVEIMIANYLYSKGFVVAGERKAIDNLLQLHHNGKMSELAVSGAFHTPLMRSAQPILAQALHSMDVKMPQIKVYSNVTGKPYKSNDDIRNLLPRQLVEPVQWQMIMTDICQSNYEQSFYEIGPGRQLTAVLAKIDKRRMRKSKNIEV